MLLSLHIDRVRNLGAVHCEQLAQHNVLFGANGSGKTSFLEAIHLLGTGRSFRSGSPRTLISHGEQDFVVRGVSQQREQRPNVIALQRKLDGQLSVRVEGQPTKSIARLADALPLLVINAQSFDLLTGEPANRRRFMDWGLFHVEQAARESRNRFQRALIQRNQLLRRGKMSAIELDVWTQDLAKQGEEVSRAREGFLKKLVEPFNQLLERLAPDLNKLDLRYRPGWDSSLSFLEALEKGRASDVEQGFTHSGPQRADIRVQIDGYPAAETLSRGQQKLVVCALKLAQGQLLAGQNDGNVLCLVDDLPSELDAEKTENVCRALSELGVQSVITCVDPSVINVSWLCEPSECRMFHVEHGGIEQVSASQ
ncbi:MAG: DNA replication/repair protein RecF [Pseudomonadota bacterium]